jgi:hypothetical protein
MFEGMTFDGNDRKGRWGKESGVSPDSCLVDALKLGGVVPVGAKTSRPEKPSAEGIPT